MKIKSVFAAVFFLLSPVPAVFSQVPMPTLPPAERRPGPPKPRPLLGNGAKIAVPEFFKTGEITGRLGGAKAIVLEKPVYPDEARSAGAEGKVRVEIAIDEDGNVTSARAVNGPPELYPAAEKAALKSRFTVPKTNGVGAPVSGYLNYDFIIETPNWSAVAYGLAAFDIRPVAPGAIRKALPAGWTGEHELLGRLGETRRVDPQDLRPQIVVESKTASGNSAAVARRIQGRLNVPPFDYEAAAVRQELIAALRQRLANDPPNLWRYDLCFELLESMRRFYDPVARQAAAQTLRQSLENAPPNVSAEVRDEIKKIVEIFEQKSPGGFRPNGGETVDIHREIAGALSAMFAGK